MVNEVNLTFGNQWVSPNLAHVSHVSQLSHSGTTLQNIHHYGALTFMYDARPGPALPCNSGMSCHTVPARRRLARAWGRVGIVR